MSAAHDAEYFRTLAEFLERDLMSENPVRIRGALRRIRDKLPPFRALSDAEVKSDIRHGDYLHVVAREAGFANWRDIAEPGTVGAAETDVRQLVLGTPYGSLLFTVAGGAVHLGSNLRREEANDLGSHLCNAWIDGVEQFLMSLAGDGVDVTDPRFARGIVTMMDTAGNRFDGGAYDRPVDLDEWDDESPKKVRVVIRDGVLDRVVLDRRFESEVEVELYDFDDHAEDPILITPVEPMYGPEAEKALEVEVEKVQKDAE